MNQIIQKNIKDNIESNYNKYHLDATYQTLTELLQIINKFKTEGSARLQAFITMRKRNEGEILRLTGYLRDARAKMATEYDRADKYSRTYNKQFYNNIGDYYHVLSDALSKMRSHLSAMNTVLRRGCYRKVNNTNYLFRTNTNPKSLINDSVIGNATFSYSVFPMEEEPDCVQNLFEHLKAFYLDEKKCLELCIQIIEQEKELRKKPEYCLMLLNEDRNRAWKKLENQIYLITDEVIAMLKETNNVYIERSKYVLDKDFATSGFHKYTECEMDHFHLLTFCIAQHENGFTEEELSLWKTQFDTIEKVRLVIAEFDNLLPDDFNQQDMGRYIFYFCKWAFPSNIKKVHQYFMNTYKGQHKVTKYSSVSSHSSTFSEVKVEYRSFLNNINRLLTMNGKIDWRKEFEIVLSAN